MACAGRETFRAAASVEAGGTGAGIGGSHPVLRPHVIVRGDAGCGWWVVGGGWWGAQGCAVDQEGTMGE